jgi:hypothetical protein
MPRKFIDQYSQLEKAYLSEYKTSDASFESSFYKIKEISLVYLLPTKNRDRLGETRVADAFQYADDIGPAKIVYVYEPSIQLKAILVVDNVARGPAIGGARMAPDVNIEKCCRLQGL